MRTVAKAPYDVWAAAARQWLAALCDWQDAMLASMEP